MEGKEVEWPVARCKIGREFQKWFDKWHTCGQADNRQIGACYSSDASC